MRKMIPIHDYVKLSGAKCPYCHKEAVHNEKWIRSGNRAYQSSKCTSCDKRWTDVFSLFMYQIKNEQ